jgi:hypothetical protein
MTRFYNSIRDIYAVNDGDGEMILGICDSEFIGGEATEENYA